MSTRRPMRVDVGDNLIGRLSDVGIDENFSRLKMNVEGMEERLKNTGRSAVPIAYTGTLVFQPETTTFNLDTSQNGVSSNAVAYVVRSGVTYEIPIQIGGKGLFVAHSINVAIWQRLYRPTTGIARVSQMPVMPMVNQFTEVDWTTKFSLYPKQPDAAPSIGSPLYTQSPSINYRWNLRDQITGSLYANELIPGSAIMERHFVQGTANVSNQQPVLIPDGEIHEFAAPWTFELGQNITFFWRPLTDVVQFGNSLGSATTGLGFDDRENGIRNQAVTVQVELHGEAIFGGTP